MTLVSVILPCYNAGEYLPLAIESVISQSYQDIEIIALDDKSTDNTLETLFSYAKQDSRIRIIENAENIGLIRTLNKGIDLAKGQYVARMDQDDICSPERLDRQIQVLEQDEKLDLVSCKWTVIDENGRKLYKSLPRTFTEKSNLLESFFGPPFGHPTVTIRTSTIKRYYYRFSENTKHIEDYDLWARMLLDGIRTRVLDEDLFQYRSFVGNTTFTHHKTQSKNMIFCGTENLKQFLDVEIPEDIQKTVFNRQDASIGSSELCDAIEEFIAIKEVYVAKVGPNREEVKQIDHFSSNHISDILIQYALKNENPSYLTVARIVFKNLSVLLRTKNVLYNYTKLISLFRRKYRSE